MVGGICEAMDFKYAIETLGKGHWDNAKQCQGLTWDTSQEWPLKPLNVQELLIFAVPLVTCRRW